MAVARLRRAAPLGAGLIRWWAGLGTWRKVGIGVFAVQFLAMAAFSQVQASRGALTWDFSIYWQAVWLIAHGHLDPFSTLLGYPFYQSHFELIVWPMSLLYWAWPHPVLLKWIQDAALAGASLVAYLWVGEITNRSGLVGRPRALALLVAAGLLIANPWTYWAAGFDFHLETVAGFLVMT